MHINWCAVCVSQGDWVVGGWGGDCKTERGGAYCGGDDNNIAWHSLVPDSCAKLGMCGRDVWKVGLWQRHCCRHLLQMPYMGQLTCCHCHPLSPFLLSLPLLFLLLSCVRARWPLFVLPVLLFAPLFTLTSAPSCALIHPWHVTVLCAVGLFHGCWPQMCLPVLVCICYVYS